MATSKQSIDANHHHFADIEALRRELQKASDELRGRSPKPIGSFSGISSGGVEGVRGHVYFDGRIAGVWADFQRGERADDVVFYTISGGKPIVQQSIGVDWSLFDIVDRAGEWLEKIAATA